MEFQIFHSQSNWRGHLSCSTKMPLLHYTEVKFPESLYVWKISSIQSGALYSLLGLFFLQEIWSTPTGYRATCCQEIITTWRQNSKLGRERLVLLIGVRMAVVDPCFYLGFYFLNSFADQGQFHWKPASRRCSLRETCVPDGGGLFSEQKVFMIRRILWLL